MDCLKFFEKFTKPSGKCIFFLDRNIISMIKDINLGKDMSDEHKQDILDKLNRIDQRENIITPILSVFEGEHGRLDTEDEIKNTVKKETYVLKNFFKKATVDKSIYKELLPLFLEGKLSPEFNIDIFNKIKFLQVVNAYIYQPVSPAVRAEFKDNIVNHLSEFKIDKCNPIVVAVLCTLYGNEVCRKILKPKEDVNKTNYYNAVMDFQHFSIYATLAGQMKGNYSGKQGAFIDCQFLTSDKSLNEFFTWFNYNKVNSSIDNGFINIDIAISEKGISNIPDELKDLFEIK